MLPVRHSIQLIHLSLINVECIQVRLSVTLRKQTGREEHLPERMSSSLVVSRAMLGKQGYYSRRFTLSSYALRHTEITSFMASLCKVCYLFQDNTIPPNVHLNNLNPRIKWKQWKLRVPTESEVIKPRHKSGKLLVSMNSSGIGGSNAHIVVESYKPSLPAPAEDTLSKPVLLLAGALSESTTAAVGKQLTTLVESENLAEIALAYGRRGMQMNWRSFSVVLPGATPTFSAPRFIPRNRPALVYVLSGQGPQHINSKFVQSQFIYHLSFLLFLYSGSTALRSIPSFPQEHS